jgi:hypothetical protein
MKMAASMLMLVGILNSSPATAITICLKTRDIAGASSDDGKIMKFTMRNGQTYTNHLRGSCPDLKFNGFVWSVPGVGQVCENTQSLHVLNSGETCVLGKFDAPAVQSPG